MNDGRRVPRLRRWLSLRRGALLSLLLGLALLAPHLDSGTELVRIRNALSLGPELTAGDDWQPPAMPADFKTDAGVIDPYFRKIAESLRLAELPDDDSRVRAISAHLLGSAPRLIGNPVRASLRETHRAITSEGRGYCGDFVRVYKAIANSAGMTVRPWAFSFDGFGGHGHILIESWNHQRLAWQVVDVFQNYEYVRSDGIPLSVRQLRTALLAQDPELRLRALHPAARPGWVIEAKAWTYLQRGVDEWYALWGSNVMTRDRSTLVTLAGELSPSLKGVVAIALGLQPQARLLSTASNEAKRRALHDLRGQVLLAGGLLVTAMLMFLLSFIRRGKSRAPSPMPHGDRWPRVCVVGPLPPPSGGMANQCEQLVRLLREDGAEVKLVRTNAPYRPALVRHVPMVRAGFRLVPYLVELWRATGRSQVVHVFANSGWAWHLLAAPALWMARLRGVPAVVNYRGGQADEFFSRAPGHVLRALRTASLRVTPSAFLVRVFARHGLNAEIVPNVIDLTRFAPRPWRPVGENPHFIVTRNLEPIYDIPTALRALVQIRTRWPGARLTVAGSGPERDALQRLSDELGIGASVTFAGRIDNARIGLLYAQADVLLNPSTADNMPISILEALASGVPVVSTDAGGIPDLVRDGETALLVRVGDFAAMADAAARILSDPTLAEGLRRNGLDEVSRYAWPSVRNQWREVYWRAIHGISLAEVT